MMMVYNSVRGGIIIAGFGWPAANSESEPPPPALSHDRSNIYYALDMAYDECFIPNVTKVRPCEVPTSYTTVVIRGFRL